MPGAIFAEGDDVALTTIEEDDLPFLRDTINDPAVRQYLGRRNPVNLAQERAFFDEVVADDETVNLLITADGEPVGTIGLHPVDATVDTAETGLFLAESAWGQGYGTEATRLMTDIAFRERRCHRVIAHVFDGNVASRRIFETLGYRHEATFREAGFLDGEYVDQHQFAVLDHEWLD